MSDIQSRKKTPRPPINQPYRVNQYICKNCGMHIEVQHRHTRKECQAYLDDPTKPDLAARRSPLLGSNDSKVMLPFYFEEAGE